MAGRAPSVAHGNAYLARADSSGMAETAPVHAAPSHVRYQLGGFLIGLIVFGLGWSLDRFADIGGSIPSYSAALLIPFELVIGIVLTVLLGLMSDRHGGMAIWHACLWMTGGMVVGWMLWTAYALGG